MIYRSNTTLPKVPWVNAYYVKGNPKTVTFPFLSPNEDHLFTAQETPTATKGGKSIGATTTTTVTGTLKYSFGDKSDTESVGGKGRIRINAVGPAGATMIVYDSSRLTTLGSVTTVIA
jgi:hypothetical protein